jgi:transcriptional regulator with XRE-family HTH domain
VSSVVDDLGSLVRQLDEERRRAGLTTSELARLAGIPRSTVRDALLGAGNPRARTVFALAAALGLSLVVARRTRRRRRRGLGRFVPRRPLAVLRRAA